MTGRGDAYRYLAGSIAAFPSVDELIAMERRSGFHHISALPLCHGAATILLSEK